MTRSEENEKNETLLSSIGVSVASSEAVELTTKLKLLWDDLLKWGVETARCDLRGLTANGREFFSEREMVVAVEKSD